MPCVTVRQTITPLPSLFAAFVAPEEALAFGEGKPQRILVVLAGGRRQDIDAGIFVRNALNIARELIGFRPEERVVARGCIDAPAFVSNRTPQIGADFREAGFKLGGVKRQVVLENDGIGEPHMVEHAVRRGFLNGVVLVESAEINEGVRARAGVVLNVLRFCNRIGCARLRSDSGLKRGEASGEKKRGCAENRDEGVASFHRAKITSKRWRRS